MGEYVRTQTPAGVKITKTSDALLDKLREVCLERDALRLQILEMQNPEVPD